MLLLELRPGIGHYGENSNDKPERVMVLKIVDHCLGPRSEENFSTAYDFLESDWGGQLWDQYYESFRELTDPEYKKPAGSPSLKNFGEDARRNFNRWKRGDSYTGKPVKEGVLIEGGKATEKLGTERATQADMKAALRFVAKHVGVPYETLKDRLLGSARLTFAGSQKDSGDVDIALNSNELDQDATVEKMTAATGNKPHVTGGNVFSFAVPVEGGKKVQVDLMFVPDIEWAKFSHYASEHSKYKSAVRNELLHSALKFSMEPGKDVRLKDDDGNDIARASRAYKLDKGVERIFKISPLRKDGKGGRVKAPVHATPDQVKQVLDQEGHNAAFSPEADTIRDPEKFAKLLFGPKAAAKDMMSTEQLINMIRKHKAKDAIAIFKDAIRGIERLKLDVPSELQRYKT